MMNIKLKTGFIRFNKFLSGTNGQTKMYNIIPTIFLGFLKEENVENDYIIGLDWLLWTAYLQIGIKK